MSFLDELAFGPGRDLKAWARSILLALALLAVALVVLYFTVAGDFAFLRASVYTGSPNGVYYATGDRLAALPRKRRGRLQVVATAGSVENIARLADENGKCTPAFAFVQDGVPVPADAGLSTLGRLPQPESLLLLPRRGRGISSFDNLRGASVGIGPEGSGTAYLMKHLLENSDLEGLNLRPSNHELDGRNLDGIPSLPHPPVRPYGRGELESAGDRRHRPRHARPARRGDPQLIVAIGNPDAARGKDTGQPTFGASPPADLLPFLVGRFQHRPRQPVHRRRVHRGVARGRRAPEIIASSGERFAMEADFVHTDGNDFAVVGILMKPGGPNATFNRIISTMPPAEGAPAPADAAIDPNGLLPGRRSLSLLRTPRRQLSRCKDGVAFR